MISFYYRSSVEDMGLKMAFILSIQGRGQQMMLKESLHSCMGLIFDEKDFHDAFPEVIAEYTKKCDPDLAFNYYTGANDRYKGDSLQSFNVLSSSGVE